jgi:nucleotide-binding universal stress UspA family protein
VAPTTDVLVAVTAGEPFVEISDRAEAERAELIVVGRHGRREWPRDALGSTTERVLRQGRTAVLVVVDLAREPYRRPLVAVDEEGSEAPAIELMARIVGPHVRGALAVHVLDVAHYSMLSQYGLSDQEIGEYLRAQAALTRAKIERALDEVGGTELDFDVRFVEGNPREAILQSARVEQADLVVLGTHGRRGFHHLLFGSVAEAAIHKAEIDVLVAHAPRG